MTKPYIYQAHQLYVGSCVQVAASCDSTGGVTGYGDLGRLVDDWSKSGKLSSAKRTLYRKYTTIFNWKLLSVKEYTQQQFVIVTITLDLDDDLAEDLFLREEEVVLLPCGENDLSVVKSPSESEGISFSSSSELSVTI